MLNNVTLMGRICNEIELRRTGSGTAVASFTLAVDRDAKNASGEKETDFIDIVCWGKTAEFVDKFFGKGKMAIVKGRLQARRWEDKDGNKRKSVEVVAESFYFGEAKSNNSDSATAPANNFNTGFGVLDGEDFGLPF